MGNETSHKGDKDNFDDKPTTDSSKTEQSTNVNTTNKSDNDQKHQNNKQVNTPEYTFKVGDKIDARDKNGIWRQCTIVDHTKSNSQNICAILKLAPVNSSGYVMKLEVTSLNICSCSNEYCFKYNPTSLQWSNHMIASPNTQSKKWNDLQTSLYSGINNTSSNQKSDMPFNVVKPLNVALHFQFTLIVFGFMRLHYEEPCNQMIPIDIKQLIYMFWEHWTRLKVNDGFRIKSLTETHGYGVWRGAVVRHTQSYTFHSRDVLQITYAYCPNILKIGDKIDAKDRNGKWYVAEIIAIKKAKKKFSMDAPKKKKKKLKKLKKLAAIYVHFLEFGHRFNEWIFLKEGVMCNCYGKCLQSDHRITSAKTQSYTYGIGGESYTFSLIVDKFCDCNEKCDNSEHRLKYTENYELERSSNMYCFC